MRFESDFGGPGSGAALTCVYTHPNTQVLEAAAAQLAEQLAEYGLTDIDSGLGDGQTAA